MNARIHSLPDVLLSSGGKEVSAEAEWEMSRRQEIIELFREHVYGRDPVGRPDSLSFRIKTTKDMMEGRAARKEVEISFKGPGGEGAFPFTLFIPKNSTKPVPVALLINNRGVEEADPERNTVSGFWPAEYIVSRGYAAAVFQVEDLDPDHDDGFRNGVHAIFDPPGQPRPSNAWATIAAWAWGASRVMDYLETDPDVDSSRVIAVGHSRGGKTALWAGANDKRFAMVVSNNSGSTGAAIARGKSGERIHDINTKFPHWFTGNYKNYNHKEDDLPVDQHMLLSLIAPRPLYVASATGDQWADPESEFLSLAASERVYRLYGLQGLGTASFPQPESPVHGHKMGYHLRAGKHDLQEYDWKCFLDFADNNL
ncbi:MAG: acetyl xylan esterase [Paenibacillus sp.]|nr:acetyl xylan esterase [Paenibacillus sp.]